MLKLYNTETRTIEEFIPGGTAKASIADYPPVTIYSCGPTVYGYAHIGNFRTFVFNDILRRYLKYRGYTVDHTMNITDVDDKTIRGSREKNISLKEYTSEYTEIFFEDLKSLNVEKVEHYPRATESIDAMNDIINKLDQKGLLYEKEGSLYFSIDKFDNYGQLTQIDADNIKSGTRYDTDEYAKDDVRDFALWKAVDTDEPGWQIDKGYGRPGWHIECSAMIRKIYGTTIDIHTGGVDLVFPHHENEIAQSEAAYDEKFVRYWIHSEHLLVDNSKMSKSKGNFFTLRDLLDKGYTARQIRFLLLGAHYRKQLNFTLENLKNSDQPLSRIDNLVSACESAAKEGTAGSEIEKMCTTLLDRTVEAMDADFNVSGALGHLFEFISDINKYMRETDLTAGDGTLVIETLKKVDSIFGIIFYPKSEDNTSSIDAGAIEALIEERNQAKKDKNFARADQIRDELLAQGIVLEDSKEGTRWKQA